MRKQFCNLMLEEADNPLSVFLTGDLGFMALEDVKNRYKERFYNCGIAEQNMVSLSAGLAFLNLKPWVYSISPFLYARALEQIRNDICQHGFPVNLVGNGGGYAYGVMGPTHHALEDYGILSTLPEMKIFIPAFNEDLQPIVSKMRKFISPSYLRLGQCEKPKNEIIPCPYHPLRKILQGQQGTLLVVGSLTGILWKHLLTIAETQRPSLWVLTELPITKLMLLPEFISELKKSRKLIISEEHVENGGAAQQLVTTLMILGIKIDQLIIKNAKSQRPELYGSQEFHRFNDGLLSI